jgi:hypothetical protein
VLSSLESGSDRRAYVMTLWWKFIRSPAFRRHIALCKHRETQLVNVATGSFSFSPVKVPLDITFDKLSLTLKSNNAPLLNDIFGSFKAFNITALMVCN